MAEGIIGALALELTKGVVTKAGERILERLERKVKRVISFKKKWKKIGENLIELSNYVRDATSKYEENPDPIKRWTIKLYQAALDVQDVLDLIQAHEDDPPFSVTGFHVRFKLRMEKRMEDIKSSIGELYDQVSVLRLVIELDNPRLRQTAALENLRRQGCTLTEENTSVGLDSKVFKVYGLLEHNKVVAVVGMGGIGKTRLFQHLFKILRSEYEVAIWLSITQNYSIHSLQSDVLSQLKYPSTLEDVQANDNCRRDIILQLFSQKKSCLLVLDDVWDLPGEEAGKEFANVYHKLRKIGLPEHGNFNILVSTRETNVAKHFKAEICEIEVLNEKQSMELFCYHATPRLQDEEVVRNVLKKCGGLPLAVLAVAGVLAHQCNDNWHLSLGDLESFPSNESSTSDALSRMVMSALGLSYKALAYHLKRCFASLSFFSSRIEFREEEVVCLWQAQGLVKSVQDARSAIEELISRSLLRKVQNTDGRVPIKRCLSMHDKVSDLAWSISAQIGDLCCDVHNEERWNNARFLNLSCGRMPEISESLRCGEKVSTLSLFNNPDIGHIPPKFLEEAESLKVLDISRTHITNLPRDLFSSLKLLKYLNISYTHMEEVPICISMLSLLECLYLPQKVQVLPEWMGELSRLQVIQSHAFSTLHNAKWVSKLNCLRVIGNYTLKIEEGGLGWSDLCTLPLQSIVIEGDPPSILGREDSVPPNSLESLYAKSEDVVCNMPDSWKSIINIEVLDIVNIRLPKWMDLFGRLRVLILARGTVEGCHVKDVAWLPRLQRLFLGFNSQCRWLPEEFGRRRSFPMLNDLEIEELTNLEEMPEMEEGAMPSLKCLVIKDCPTLRYVSSGWDDILSRLDLLYIEGCEEDFKKVLKSTNMKACMAWKSRC